MSNIVRNKDNQTMKFGHLIESDVRNIIEKSYTKYGGENSHRHSSGKLKLSISLDQWSKGLYCLFLLHPKSK